VQPGDGVPAGTVHNVPVTPARAVLLASGQGFAGMFMLFAVLPVLGSQSLGAVGAGLATTAFMITTVITQVFVPTLMARFAPGPLFAASLLLLGLPAVAYLLDLPAGLFLAITAIRGIGFGLLTIVSVSLAAHYADPARQGAAQGFLGLVTSLSGVATPGIGLWLLDNTARAIPLTLGVIIPLIGLVFLGPILRASPRPISRRHDRSAGPRTPVSLWLFLPVFVFLPSAIVYGALYTFLPLESAVAPIALIAVGVGYVLGRSTGGRLVDIWSMSAVLIPATLIGAAAIAMIGLVSSDIVDIAMAAILGATIGAGGTAALTGMLHVVEPSLFGLVSMSWNITFDAGILLSGILIGVVIATAGFTVAMSVLAIWLAVASLIAIVALPRMRGLRDGSHLSEEPLR
jgi:predicted MFS family arabinose efflux permease